MRIAVLTITLHLPWSNSLKEKRMEVRSIKTRIKNKFNVSVAETDAQDLHQIIVLTMAAVAGNSSQADSIIDNALKYIESNTDAMITDVSRQVY